MTIKNLIPFSGKGLLLLSIFFLFSMNLNAQNNFFKGQVLDTESKQPIAFATILIKPSGESMLSDRSGIFSIPARLIHANSKLEFSSLTYFSKEVAINELLQGELTRVYLSLKGEQQDAQVEVEGISHPRTYVKQAIAVLGTPLYADSMLYQGYYREYLQDEEEKLNLFESILAFQESRKPGTSALRAELLLKRFNKEFHFDSALYRAMLKNEKHLPAAMGSIAKANELQFLRDLDPIQNPESQSVSFIGIFKNNFLEAHRFSEPRKVTHNDRGFLAIQFESKQIVKQGLFKLKAKGEMFIDLKNMGIKKFDYRVYLDKGSSQETLYEMMLGYKLFNEQYILSYASLSNHLMLRNFYLAGIQEREGKLQFQFSRKLNQAAILPEMYQVSFKGISQEPQKIEIADKGVFLSFNQDSELGKALSGKKKDYNFREAVLPFLDVSFNNITDEFGGTLSNEKYLPFVQYREFFTQEAVSGYELQGSVDPELAVSENLPLNSPHASDTCLNTPLNTVDARIYPTFLQNKFISQKTLQDIQRKDQILYLHVDREVYAPQDTIWFKGYVRKKVDLKASPQGKEFFISLVQPNGSVIISEKFFIEDSSVKGQLLIPAKLKDGDLLEDGMYFLTAYTSWMKNEDPEQIFVKKILIEKERRENIKLIPVFDKSHYYPGDSVEMHFMCLNPYNKQLDEVRFSFEVKTEEQTIKRQNGMSDTENEHSYKFALPDSLNSQPLLITHTIYQGRGILDTLKMPVNHFLNLNFFPEGGHLLEGEKTVVAFKAETREGLPLYVEGSIINQKGEKLAGVFSEHDGMGKFELLPQHGENYYFDLEYPACFSGKYALPEAKESGMLLSLEKINKSIIANIINLDMEGESDLLTVMLRGKLVFYKVFNSKRTSSINIPADDLPQGVLVVTLFDSDLIPRSERLIFNKIKLIMGAEITSNQKEYAPRDNVIVNIQVKGDPDYVQKGSYSLSVVDNELCSSERINEANVVSSLLLSPEIKGRVYRPEYYFKPENTEAEQHLDLLLLTQGWRNYKLIKNDVLNKEFKMPANMELIRGTLKGQPFGKKEEAVSGSLSVFYAGLSTPVPVNKNGRFAFLPDYNADHNSAIILFAENQNGKPQVRIELDEPDFMKQLDTLYQQLADGMKKNQKTIYRTQSNLDKEFNANMKYHYWLDEVLVRKTLAPEAVEISDLIENKKTFKGEDIYRFADFEDLFEYYKSYGGSGGRGMVHFVVDGIIEDNMEYIYNIDPEDILKVNIVKGPEIAIYGINPAGFLDGKYVFEIQLDPDRYENNDLWNSTISIPNFALSKEFYSPVYDDEAKRNSPVPDLRKTIYWNNEVRFDENGKARINFYNGDRYTRIKCVLEGIDERGVPIHTEYIYSIQ